MIAAILFIAVFLIGTILFVWEQRDITRGRA